MRPLTGKVIGAHQKIDRLAREGLTGLIGDQDTQFPSARRILHFEGVNGPDAIKRKSPAKDEPWHYYIPFDEGDTRLLAILELHYHELVAALKKQDQVRAAFEAAWLAHAIVDGLTPAHHYPYEEKLMELRGGKGLETRTTLKDKIIMPGTTRREKVSNNWKMWGVKGLLMSHFAFEIGISLMMMPLNEKNVAMRPEELAELEEYGMVELFRRKAKEIATLGIYDMYQRHGWTPQLARKVRKRIVPSIVHMVVLAWYAAAVEAGIVKRTAA